MPPVGPSGGASTGECLCEVLCRHHPARKGRQVRSESSVVAGIDVHKRILVVVVARAGAAEAPLAEGKFPATRAGLAALKQWLRECGTEAVVMESTAQYWWPVWLELEQDWPLHLAQARSNAAAYGRKTDFQDAARLVRRFFSGDLRMSFVPKPEQRAWRRLARTWKSLGEQIVEARNEIEALLEEGQIKLSCLLSDLLGVSGRRILRALAEGSMDPAALAQMFDRRVRASQQERIDALSGHLPPAHRLVLRQHLDRIDLLDRQRAELQRQLTESMQDYQPAVRRLAEVPGMNVVAAQHLIAEIGPDVAAFPSPQQLASWAGVCPGRQESAGESRSNRSPKGNRFVRGLICQIAHAASRTKGSSWEGQYGYWQKRLGPQKALWALAHRLLRLVWKMLAQGMDYVERGPRRSDPARLKARMKRLRHEFRIYGMEIQFTPIQTASIT